LQVNMEKHIQVGDSLALMHRRLPELGSSLTYAEISAFQPSVYAKVPAGLEAPYQLTQARLKAASGDAP